MLNNAAFSIDKNLLYGKPYIFLVEFRYEDAGVPQYIRLAQYDVDVTWNGALWKAFPIAPIETSQNLSGELPAFDISVGNVDRMMQSTFEYYKVVGLRGSVYIIKATALADPTAVIDEPFTVQMAKCRNQIASVTCAPLPWNPIETMIPRRRTTRREFPGMAMNRNLAR